MKENFDEALKAVLKHEGGFVNHPKDPGGMTNLGVTKRVWEEWVGRKVDEKEMRSLTPELVAPMYRKKYWDAVKGDDLPEGIDYLLFDFAINAGPVRAIRTLQKATGLTTDGILGPKTLGVLKDSSREEMVARFSEEKEAFYRSLNTFSTFGKGWLRRVAETKTHAESMLA
jgi:lysozyme family protein